MARLSRIPVRVTATGVGIALCMSVPLLAASGVFGGGTSHSKPNQHRNAHAVSSARLVAVERIAARRWKACDHAIGATGHLPAERYRGAVRIAQKYRGVRYVWGGSDPRGFDTSGLVKYVYEQLGVSLPHWAVGQYCYPHAVHPARSRLQPGDLVFFADRSHVAIYMGHNKIIDAPHTGAVVQVERLSGWYSRTYYGATRILR
jgi:cell wall-associated NlpC family hydrolase